MPTTILIEAGRLVRRADPAGRGRACHRAARQLGPDPSRARTGQPRAARAVAHGRTDRSGQPATDGGGPGPYPRACDPRGPDLRDCAVRHRLLQALQRPLRPSGGDETLRRVAPPHRHGGAGRASAPTATAGRSSSSSCRTADPPTRSTSTGERIRQAVAEAVIPHGARPSSPSLFVTLSGGVSSWTPGSPLTLVEVLEEADQALLEAKSDGRNRVYAAPSRRRHASLRLPVSLEASSVADAGSDRRGRAGRPRQAGAVRRSERSEPSDVRRRTRRRGVLAALEPGERRLDQPAEQGVGPPGVEELVAGVERASAGARPPPRPSAARPRRPRTAVRAPHGATTG